MRKHKQYSNHKLKGYLTKYSKQYNKTPRMEDFTSNKNLPAPITYVSRFGSWNSALKQAGLKINVRKDFSDKELLGTLKKLNIRLGRTPIMKDFASEKGLPEATVFKDHFGSWNNALKLAGLEVKYPLRKWTKEELLYKLRKKATKLGKCPTQRDIDKDSSMPAKGNYRKYFGTFNNAVRSAGLQVNYKISKKELIKILQKLYLKLNRTPTREDLKIQKDCPSVIPFVEKFGSYTAACLRAGLIPNEGRNNNIWKSWQKHCEDMAKAIHGEIETQKKGLVDGWPDIFIPKKGLFIDAKTCGYKDFKEQIRKYCKNDYKLEFWLIFKGIETKRKNVKYVYAKELAKLMEKIERKDLAIKCHQFIKNVFSEDQSMLSPKII